MNAIEILNSMVGHAILKIVGGVGSTELLFFLDDARVVTFTHSQNCCEYVSIDDIVGDMNDLLGEPLLVAEETSSADAQPPEGTDPESYTWTFYRFRTHLGSVDMRWYGSSNGYYSEGVDVDVRMLDIHEFIMMLEEIIDATGSEARTGLAAQEQQAEGPPQ